MGTYTPVKRILYVDDEPALLSAFTSLMRKEDVTTHVLQDSNCIEQVLVSDGPFAVVFSDQRMPGLDGVGVLEAAGRIHPATVRVMVTGFSEHLDTTRAINIGGIAHYVAKPWKDDELRRLTSDCIERYNLAQEKQFLTEELAAANIALNDMLDGTVGATVRILGDLLEFVNADAAAHAGRIRQLGRAVLELMPEITPGEKWNAARAIDLCFLGIAVLPPWIQISLNKQGLGSLSRFPEARNHHLLAAGLVKDIPRFGEVARILRLQTKDYNGSGDPPDEFVKGAEIPLGARLLHILVGLDRLSSPNFKGSEVLNRMMEQTGKYDNAIIARMLNGAPARPGSDVETEIEIGGLERGMVVLEDILSPGGQCLARSGFTLSDTSVNILRQLLRGESADKKVRVRRQSPS